MEDYCKHLLASLGLASAVVLLTSPAIAQQQPISNSTGMLPSIAQIPGTADAPSTLNQLFVNPTTGNDTSGNGSAQAPFKTITQALQVAVPNTVIVLAPGTYSTETGETFPIQLKPGVTLQGDPSTKGRNILIKGGGFFLSPTFARQNIAILGVNQSGLAGVTVTNPNRRGYGLWIESSSPVVADNTLTGNTHDGISVTGNSAPLIRGNYFSGNGANGLSIFNISRPEVRDNVFENTGFGMTIAQDSAPLLVSNRLSQNRSGVVVQGQAEPILRGNTIENNSDDGLVAIAQSRPDLGTATQPGNNIFRNNRRHNVDVKASNQSIPAFGNQIVGGRINGRLDLAGTSSATRSTPTATPRQVAPPPVAVSAPPARQTRPATTPTPPPLPASTSQREPVQVTPTIAPPPPNLRAVSQPVQVRPTESAPVSTDTRSGAVVINVPAPESGFVLRQPQPTLQPPVPREQRGGLPALDVQPGLLPVPGAEIPVGNTGRLSRGAVSSNTSRAASTRRRGGRTSPPPLPSRAAALGLRYRVVVEVENDRQQSLVRSLVPDAFRTRYNGRVVLQVGAYSDRTEADEMLLKMTSNGLNAVLQEL